MTLTLSSLPKSVTSRKKRLGRGLGSGSGAKSGRGTTRHQTAREKIPLHFEGGQGRFIKRFPLLRGKSKNKSIHEKAHVISLEAMNIFADNSAVSRESLVEKGLVNKLTKNSKIKVVVKGKLERKLVVSIPVSEKAKKQIEKLGGEVVQG
jgi:large subunit ribosomal protein L15